MKKKRKDSKDNNVEVRKRNKKLSIILVFMQLISIAISVVCIWKIWNWYTENKKNSEFLNEANSYIQIEDTVIVGNTEVEKFKVDFDELKKKNSDIFAWLKVNGTEISYPVVHTNNNDFYLTHSLDKSYNSAGWIFADCANKADGTDKNLVIYGHNRRDGTMFGTLQRALKKDWYDNEENKFITFERENGTEVYQVFSVYQIESETYYITTGFTDDTEFEKFLKTIKSRSVKDFGVDVNKDDNIITLSTCANNNKYRVVLHAKKVF